MQGILVTFNKVRDILNNFGVVRDREYLYLIMYSRASGFPLKTLDMASQNHQRFKAYII